MDQMKCDALKARLGGEREEEPQLAPIAEFFDGNDDIGSIGCNLDDHPGIDTFRAVFAKVAARDDVEAVYAVISELDPGEESWPFTDTVYVVGNIPEETLSALVAVLQPDNVGPATQEYLPVQLLDSGKRILAVWWD